MRDQKLTPGQLHILKLISREQDAEGWSKASKIVLPCIRDNVPRELVEIGRPHEDGGGYVRLTERGRNVLDLEAYFA